MATRDSRCHFPIWANEPTASFRATVRTNARSPLPRLAESRSCQGARSSVALWPPLAMGAAGSSAMGLPSGRTAGPASVRTRIDRPLGDLIPPLLLFRRPDLSATTFDAGELIILVERWRTVRVVRSLLAEIGGDGTARDLGSLLGGGRALVTWNTSNSLRHGAPPPDARTQLLGPQRVQPPRACHRSRARCTVVPCSLAAARRVRDGVLSGMRAATSSRRGSSSR
jgi:hypothetical protein